MKTYTEEEVKTIISNAVQNITNKLHKQREYEEERAKSSALCFVDGNDKEDKATSLKHLYVDNVVLKNLMQEIKETQYHLKIEKLKQTFEIG